MKFIPHGIDTQFFTPDSDFNKNGSILFVGQHLRDFDAFNYAIPRIKEKIPSLIINVVIRDEFINQIQHPHLVNIYKGIDDYRLLSFYREASLLFLPLKDVTACNSILEAMSAGLPIISTDVGSNSSYIKEANGILLPKNDYFALTDAVIDLYANDELMIDIIRD
ncbi:Glycosyl transferases group 1 [compost metagenome]